MLLVLDSILPAFVTVIVRHVEPEGMIKNTHTDTQTEQDNEQDTQYSDPHSICKTDQNQVFSHLLYDPMKKPIETGRDGWYIWQAD